MLKPQIQPPSETQMGDSSPSPKSSFFNRSFTFHSNFRRFIDTTKSQPPPLPIPDPKKPHQPSLWSQTAKRLSDLTLGSPFRRSSTSKSICPPQENQTPGPPGGADRIVLYFTSLRSVRRTHDDCAAVRNIFRNFMVPVDERDVSRDSAYRRELREMLGPKPAALPQVFIRGRHIGGAEEVRQLLESGEFRKLLEGFPARDPAFVCGTCGDERFVPCPRCNGSRKVFDEEEGQKRRCSECNENGLTRCPYCCA